MATILLRHEHFIESIKLLRQIIKLQPDSDIKRSYITVLHKRFAK